MYAPMKMQYVRHIASMGGMNQRKSAGSINIYDIIGGTFMLQALALSSSTIVRARVIAERTQSDEIGIIKAMMIEQLKEKLASGVAHFIFVKKDGSLREMFATTNRTLVGRHIVGTGVTRELYKTTAVWDVETASWKSFRWESIVKVF